MSNCERKLGYYMAVTAILSFIVYTACFAAILFVNAPFTWSGITALAEYEGANTAVFKYAGMACMMVYACAYMVMVLCAAEGLGAERRVFGKLGTLFALAFCIAICINYFVQLTATRLQLMAGPAEGLTQFTQSFNISAINAVNMLGWTFFYGLSSLVMACAFKNEAKMALTCAANAAMMAAGLIGYMMNDFTVLLLTMNLGLGATGLWMAVCYLLHFRRGRAESAG